jgi:hypothetical protein
VVEIGGGSGRDAAFLAKLGCSVMNNFNNPDDLLHLRQELPQSELRIFYPESGEGQERFAHPPAPFHVKSLLFEKLDGRPSLIVGSSNLTAGGLEGNEEWNLYSNSEVNLSFTVSDARSIYQTARDEFDRYWSDESVELTPAFLEAYRPRWQRSKKARDLLEGLMTTGLDDVPLPRPAQKEAVEALAVRRLLGVSKAAVIAATGLGKTHLAAFDFQQSGMQNVLFIVHRENILREARQVFQRVLQEPRFGLILSGQSTSAERESAFQTRASVFGMIQTLSRPEVLKSFRPNQFDYLVVDEFHRMHS